jgi:hypothetical protein
VLLIGGMDLAFVLLDGVLASESDIVATITKYNKCKGKMHANAVRAMFESALERGYSRKHSNFMLNTCNLVTNY